MATRNVLLAWSSGKDSAWALYCLKLDPTMKVVGLLTTINKEYDRVNMHAVRKELLQKQIESTGISPWIVELPNPCSNKEYERIMGNVVEKAKSQGISAMAFGDLFLWDIRKYREKQLAGSGVEPLFPIWTENTHALAKQMQDSGLKAIVTCVDPKYLDESFSGREWDEKFIDDLPNGVDACGENGEFHTFAYSGTMFTHPVCFQRGDTIKRDGFVFTDLLDKCA